MGTLPLAVSSRGSLEFGGANGASGVENSLNGIESVTALVSCGMLSSFLLVYRILLV